jgi:hypothetical protein
LTNVVTVAELGASTVECQVGVMLSPTSPVNVTADSSGPALLSPEPDGSGDDPVDDPAFELLEESLALPESLPPQAASAGTRRTAARAAVGRRRRRSTESGFLVEERWPRHANGRP